MEPIETQVSRRWQLRMLLVSLGFAVFAAWFAYDGVVAYPAFNERAGIYNSLAVDQARRSEWLDLAKEKGWPTQFESEEQDARGRVKPKSQTDLRVQVGLSLFCLVAAVVLTMRIVINRGKFMVLDDGGLLTFEGRHVALDHITDIDKSRWERKSIAIIHFTDEYGRQRRTTLDDWIHSGVDEILERLEEAFALANPPPTPEPADEPPGEPES